MTDRSVSVTLQARVQGFNAGFQAARDNVRAFNSELAKSEQKRAALNELGGIAGRVGLAAGAGMAFAVKKAADFEQAMSSVDAATHESAGNMDRLREAALKAGAETVYSATEAAGAIEALAKAGVSTNDVLRGGLDGALALAAAGQVDVAFAAEAAASAMTQFSLSGKDVPHIADLLAAAAGKAQGEVTDMAQALNQSGLIASQAGLSIEETTGALAAFASAGLMGSDAGTSFKTMLMSMDGNSNKAAKAIEHFGISAYDAQGEFIGLEKYAGRLHDRLKDLSSQERNRVLKNVFGTDAIRAANILYRQGADGIGDWIEKVDEQGYAADTAARKLDNLKGDLEALGGALETAFIGTGSGAQGPLRDLTQGLTDMVNVYNKAPQGVKDTTGALLTFLALAGTGTFVLTKTVTGVASAREAFSTLGVSVGEANKKMLAARGAALLGGAALVALAQQTDKGGDSFDMFASAAGGAAMGFGVGGPWGAAIGGAAGLIYEVALASDEAGDSAKQFFSDLSKSEQIDVVRGQVDDLRGSLNQLTGAYTDATAAAIYNDLEADGTIAAFEKIGVSSRDAVRAVMGYGGATRRVDEAVSGLKDKQLATEQKILEQLYLQQDAILAGDDEAADAAQKRIDALKGEQSAIEELIPQIATRREELEADAEAVRAAAIAGQDYASVMGKIPKKAYTELQQTGIDPAKAAREIANLALKYDSIDGRDIKAIIEASGVPVTLAQVQRIIDKAREVEQQDPNVKVTATDQASGLLADVVRVMNQLDGMVANVTVRGAGGIGDLFADGGTIPGRAAFGATVPKDGGAYYDRYPYLLAPGEEVISNRNGQADAWRPLLKAINGGMSTRQMTVAGRGVGGGSSELANTVRELSQEVRGIKRAVAEGAFEGSKAGTEGRLRAMDQAQYLRTGGF